MSSKLRLWPLTSKTQLIGVFAPRKFSEVLEHEDTKAIMRRNALVIVSDADQPFHERLRFQ